MVWLGSAWISLDVWAPIARRALFYRWLRPDRATLCRGYVETVGKSEACEDRACDIALEAL